MAEQFIRRNIDGRIATVTIDSPANRNALSRVLLRELKAVFDALLIDDRVRVIVLTASDPVFCSGADLKEVAEPGDPSIPELIAPVAHLIWESPKPVIGRVNGHARGGGVGLAAACDITVASEKATFAFTEVRVGVTPAVVSVVALPKIGPTRAMELFLTGEPFSAARAAEIGLIAAAVPAEDLDAAVDRYVGSILAGAPNALRDAKRLVRDVPGLPLEAAFAMTGKRSAATFASAEAAEGMAAFAERRKPRWAEG